MSDENEELLERQMGAIVLALVSVAKGESPSTKADGLIDAYALSEEQMAHVRRAAELMAADPEGGKTGHWPKDYLRLTQCSTH